MRVGKAWIAQKRAARGPTGTVTSNRGMPTLPIRAGRRPVARAEAGQAYRIDPDLPDVRRLLIGCISFKGMLYEWKGHGYIMVACS